MRYKFGCIHKALRITLALEAGLPDHVWTTAEIAALLGTFEDQQPRKRGPYKKRRSA